MGRKSISIEDTIFGDIKSHHRTSLMTIIMNTVIINILTFISPIYMLQIYDRILPSRSIESLIAISLLAILLYICGGFFEVSRTALLKRLSLGLEKALKTRVMSVVLSSSELINVSSKDALNDIEALKKFIASSSLEALLDAIFIPLFIIALFYSHWILGWLSVIALTFFILLVALEKNSSEKKLEKKVVDKRLDAIVIADIGTVTTLGMKKQISNNIEKQNENLGAQNLANEDSKNIYLKISNTLKDVFSISIISTGAVLAINDQISPGLMIVISLLINKAMQPFSKIITIRPKLQRAQNAYKNLQSSLYDNPIINGSIIDCDIKGSLELKDVTAFGFKGQPSLIRNISVQLVPGDLFYITGGAGSGKSTLIKLMIGVDREKLGAILYDSVPIWNWDRCYLGRNVGYVPQFIVLYPGTIKENISRFLEADLKEVVRVAKLAGVHEHVCRLEAGYETYIHENMYISPSIKRKLAFARALYGNPQYIFLDSIETDLGNFDRSLISQTIQKLKDENKTLIIASENKMFGVSESLSLNLPSNKVVQGLKFPARNLSMSEPV